ncbi:MAG: tRNA(Ile)-lysidine synthase [Pseudonocardiales bacterium]|nr:tRNA(Ile)-lysidine synthase [Pseudonocardiales bacterium]
MGPHPAVAEIRRAVRAALTGSTGTVLVACSGGADSLALAAATAFEAPRHGVRAGLVTVDHGLQPGSAGRAAGVAAVGYELGFDPVTTVPVTVGRAGGPEAAARAARYGALDAAAEALGARVLLGHTLDDQAETVLLGLGRGSGPRSIAGMRAADGHYLRPLLGVRRSTTVAACTALGLAPWDDPHNADPAFQRVRLRREVLPLLEDVLQGGVAEALARTAALLRDDLDALDRIAATNSAERATSDTSGRDRQLDVAVLVDLPRALRTRTLQTWTRHHRLGPLTSVHLDALDVLVTDWHGQGPLDLPGGRVARASGKLVVQPTPHRNPQE